MKPHKSIFESEKPTIVKNLESAFKNALWDFDKPFDINDNDMYLMFDAINDGLFGNKLDRGIPKFTLKAELISKGPAKFRGLEQALAAFTVGCVRGMPHELIIVKHNNKQNFFTLTCSLIHEMIHMFDFHFGTMGKQLDKYGVTASYNFNYPFIDPRTGKMIYPSSKSQMSQINMLNAMASGFQSKKQLPNEIMDKILNPEKNDMKPRQYQLPGIQDGAYTDPDTGEIHPISKPYPKKFTMDGIDGFYDVHGDFFMNIANTVNSYGFAITDIFEDSTPTKMTKTYESENRQPANAAETMFVFFKDDEHKSCDYRDKDNWFVEIM